MTASIIAQIFAPFDPVCDLHVESPTPWWHTRAINAPMSEHGQYYGSGDGLGGWSGDGYGLGRFAYGHTDGSGHGYGDGVGYGSIDGDGGLDRTEDGDGSGVGFWFID